MSFLLPAYAVLTLALTGAEYFKHRSLQVLFKPLLALGFITVAVMGGAHHHLIGQIILAGLVACAVGDVALLSRDNPTLFQLGMAGFAVGHGLYAWAFLKAGVSPVLASLAFLPTLLSVILTYRYIRPTLPADMNGPVIAYMGIITLMVITAVGTGRAVFAIPAILFAVSDMFVARDRFVSHDPVNAIGITPLYFGAQLLFALLATGVPFPN